MEAVCKSYLYLTNHAVLFVSFCNFHVSFVRLIDSRKMKWMGHVACMEK
jgi:hypothetical protein